MGPDHGIEQKNCILKVVGRIVKITQNKKSLDKYFLNAPELSNPQREFDKTNCTGNNEKRTQHHELTEGKLSRVTQNAIELRALFYQHRNPFKFADEDKMYNLLTKSVINETVTNDILHRYEIGQQMFEDFVTKRLTKKKFSV